MDIAAGVQREMRLFKFGSGTGTNFSSIRAEGELLSSGGTSSGLMSFLDIFDKAAGATKSGGTTRRAAKMVCLDMDHPDIEKFVDWKASEEDKVLALIKAGYSSDFNGEAYRTVSGQNSNNSVRVTDEFMLGVQHDRPWQTKWRTTGAVARTHSARGLMNKVAKAAWRCADPGMQYDSTIQRWHTVPNSGRINASNPCSEFMFLDDTSCNLASINLLHFLRPSQTDSGQTTHSESPNTGSAPTRKQTFDIEGFRHACRLFLLAQEIIVDYASYPTQAIAQNSHDFRPLGLGYANLGSLLMVEGIPYDSEAGFATCSAITAIMTGAAYETSAEIAASKGPFPCFAHNREPMLRVMNQHRDAAYAISDHDSRSSAGRISSDLPALVQAAHEAWDRAVTAGERWGYRNAQATVLAPTGTIGLLMDCDTTGIEPDFALVKFKKLAGGGYFKIVNQSVEPALVNLGYTPSQIEAIVAYLRGTLSLSRSGSTTHEPPHVNRTNLLAKGLTSDEIAKAEGALPGVFELRHAFSRFVIGEAALQRLGFGEVMSSPSFDLLSALGFTKAEIDEATQVICGRLTIEGAPYLKAAHLPVFDCANRCGKLGQRYIEPMGHVRMMAAAQPFVSGAISKTVNLPKETTVEEIERVYMEAWRLGLKAIALYRDGSKSSQVLSGGGDDKKSDKTEKAGAARSTETSVVTDKTAAPVAAPVAAAPVAVAHSPAPVAALPHAAPTVAPITTPDLDPSKPPRLERRRLPKKRRGFTQEARVGGQKVYVRTGEYEDGALGEIFIDMHKEGAALRSLMNCFAISVSLGLQHGVPLDEFVNAFTFTRFEPQGPVDHPNIKFATSVIDFVFRMVGMEYPGAHRFRARQAGRRRARGGARARAVARGLEGAGRAASGQPLARGGAPSPGSRGPQAGRSLAGRLGPPRLEQRVARADRRGQASPALAAGQERRAATTQSDPERSQRSRGRDDGRRSVLRDVRPHHGPQRVVLPLPQLRKFDGLFLKRRGGVSPPPRRRPACAPVPVSTPPARARGFRNFCRSRAPGTCRELPCPSRPSRTCGPSCGSGPPSSTRALATGPSSSSA